MDQEVIAKEIAGIVRQAADTGLEYPIYVAQMDVNGEMEFSRFDRTESNKIDGELLAEHRTDPRSHALPDNLPIHLMLSDKSNALRFERNREGMTGPH